MQFTRQTVGIAGALKKIGGLVDGSKITASDAEEASHMFFGDGVGYGALFATHPPLVKRIQALEPLSQELQDFASAIREGTTPVSNSRLGLEIVLGLEALEQSLANRGEPVAVRPVDEVLAAGRQTLAAGPSGV